jgi:hypothetical protein
MCSKWVVCYTLLSLIYNIRNISELSNPSSKRYQYILCFDWIVEIILISCMVLRHFSNRMDLVVTSLFIIQLKNYIHVINIDGILINKENKVTHHQLVYQCLMISSNQILLNMLTSRKFAILTAFLSMFAMVLKLSMVEYLHLNIL